MKLDTIFLTLFVLELLAAIGLFIVLLRML